MDCGKDYISMCEKAKEIQELRHYKYLNSFPGLFRDGDDVFFQERGWREGKVTITWLPRQDQLQAMVKDSETDDFALVELFFNFVWGEDNQPSKIDSPFHSMEQFWLAFVMENNFGKVWQNGEWKPKTPPRLAVRTGEAVGD